MPFPFFRSRPQPPSEAQCLEFKDLCERTSRALSQAGVETLPYRDPSLTRFREHHDPGRVLTTFNTYVEVLESALEKGEDLRDDRRLLWRMISKMGYTPQSDIFDRIEDGDTVEIYTVDNWQIFRNPRLFECVSLSVEETITFVWNRDSRRDGKITLKLLEVLLRTRTGLLTKTIDVTDIPKHTIQELIGQKWTISIQLKYFSPLRINGRLTAGISTNLSEVLARGDQPPIDQI